MSEFKFIQLADPQFGLFAMSSGKTDKEIAAFAERGIKLRKAPKMEGFAPETELFTRAIERANEAQPEFVAVCGDMVNEPNVDAQLEEAVRIGGLLDDSIPLHWVPGNHDVSLDHKNPVEEYLDKYRKYFGPDYYSFSVQDVRFIVINSTVLSAPKALPDEAKQQLDFVESEATIASSVGNTRVVLLSHHPLFIKSPSEADNTWSIQKTYRLPLMEIARDHGIIANFAGHMHQNNVVSADGVEVVTSGPVGYPLGDDPSGMRYVTVHSDSITHEYQSLE